MAARARDEAATLVNRGILYMVRRNDSQADSDFNAAISRDDSLSDAWLNKGFATFMADLWWEHAWGRDELDRSLLDERASYFNSDGNARRP